MFTDTSFLEEYLRSLYPELKVKYVKVNEPTDSIHKFVVETNINNQVFTGKSTTSHRHAVLHILEVVNEQFN